jgi:hypothetical protein
MEFTRSLFGKAAAVAALALAAVGSAHARDVYWSVGVQAAPGVSVGVANTRPVVVQPAPVYVAPQPVYAVPPVVYTQPQVVYTQPAYTSYGYAPVVVQPAPVIAVGGGHRHWKHHHKHWD